MDGTNNRSPNPRGRGTALSGGATAERKGRGERVTAP